MMGRRRGTSSEGGQIIVLFTLVIVVLFGFVALAVDVGVLKNANQNLWNALDAGALAGASQLPDGIAAEALANQFIQANYPGGVPSGNTAVGFRCLIGSIGGSPRLGDVPSVCDPGPGATWTCNNSTCSTTCEPASGDDCNTVVVTGEVTVPFRFGAAIGVPSGSTGTVSSAACTGACGAEPSNPVDVVLIVDRTSSMNGVDTQNARSAAHSVRTMLDPSLQWLGLSMLGPSNSGGGCISQPDGNIGTAVAPIDVPRWVPVGLSGLSWQGQNAHLNQDFTNGGSTLGSAISCFSNSSTGTDLTDPIPMAVWELNAYGRPGVPKGIILMTDGQPNASTMTPADNNYCAQSSSSATNAKNAGIEIFTVAFGLDGSNDVNCPDGSGFWQNKKASALVASMATDSIADNGCPGTENDDDDHYFCVPKTAGASANLSNAFRKATTALVGSTKLIQLP